jgi:hypothetical protein
MYWRHVHILFVLSVQSFHVRSKSIVIFFILCCLSDVVTDPLLLLCLGTGYCEYKMLKLRTSKQEQSRKEKKSGVHCGIDIVLFFFLFA